MNARWTKSGEESLLTLGRMLRLNLLLLAVVAVASICFPVANLNQRLRDSFFRIRPAQPISEDTALVLIDDVSLAQYGRWPWPRYRLAQLIHAVSAVQPRAIGVDILLSEPEDEKNDSELEREIKLAQNIVLASKISTSADGSRWVEPVPRFSRVATAVGHVQAIIDADGRCRRVPIEEPSIDGPRPAFSLKLAELVRPQLTQLESRPPENRAGIELIAPRSLMVDYHQQFEPGGPTPPFTVISARELLAGKSAEKLKGKVVLIGLGTIEVSDRLFTPVSDQLPMPGVEINANVVDMLLAGRQLKSAGVAIEILLLIAASIVSLWLVVRWPGARGLLLLGTALVAGYAGLYQAFLHYRLLFPYGHILLAGIFAAPLAQLENLVVVDRAVTRRLLDLQRILNPQKRELTDIRSLPKLANPSPARLHWKLSALEKLQSELASLYAFDQTLIETMREGLAVFGPKGELLFSNTSWMRFDEQHTHNSSDIHSFACSIGGWREVESLFQSGIEAMPAPSEEAGTKWVETEVPIGEGLWRFRAVRLPWTAHAESGAVMIIAEDISARRERDQARAEALSFVTHELRTPLISIQGFAEFIMRYPTAQASCEAPATIFRESQRLVAMINTYLEVLRLDSGVRPLRLKETAVQQMILHVEQIVRPLAQSAGISIRTDLAAQDATVECDEALVSGVILNLLSNAIKYSPPNSEVTLSVIAGDCELEFSVQNSGPVIAASELEHLFEKFYRSPQHSESTPGWGLGLTFVKRICEQHGGRVAVTSNSDSGTCFSFTLPLVGRAVVEALR